MQYTTAIIALAASLSAVSAQDCSLNYPTAFEISPVNISSSSKRSLYERQNAVAECTTNPIITLCNGVLIDQAGRQGEIVANQQFQFDMPLQSDAKHTEGFGVCSNNTLSSQGSAVFYACASGGFSNLYDQSIGDQCYEVYLNVIPCAGGASAGGSSGCPVHSGSSTAASSTSASETSSASSSSTTAPASTLAPVTMHMPVPTAAAPSVPAPIFPVPSGNSSTPAVTGTAVTPPTAPTGTTTAPPTTFTGAADALVAGSKLIAAAAGLAAFILA